VAVLPDVLHQFSDALLQEPRRVGVPRQHPAQSHQFVDVLMGYGEVEQDLGQFVGVRQHGALPLPVEPCGERPSRRVRCKEE
jgi:hypothetical protein